MSRDAFDLAMRCEKLVTESWFESGREADPELQRLARETDAEIRERLSALLQNHQRRDASGVWAVVYDIEGTTTPMPFVTAVLYPCSLERLEAYVGRTFDASTLFEAARPRDLTEECERASHTPVARRNRQLLADEDGLGTQLGDSPAGRPSWSSDGGSQRRLSQPPPGGSEGESQLEHRALVSIARAIFDHHSIRVSSESKTSDIHAAITAALRDEIAANSKSIHLKLVQGRIWREAYESGCIRGHLFEDVAPAVRQLSRVPFADNVVQHVYSSGSVLAQRLLFAHSTAGNIVSCFSTFNDPAKVGPKIDVASYQRLLDAVAKGSAVERAVDLSGAIFVTDSLAEIRAASMAGWLCVLSVRPGNIPLPSTEAQFAVSSAPVGVITDFSQLVNALGATLKHVTSPEALRLLAAQSLVADYRVLQRQSSQSATTLKPFQ